MDFIPHQKYITKEVELEPIKFFKIFVADVEKYVCLRLNVNFVMLASLEMSVWVAEI